MGGPGGACPVGWTGSGAVGVDGSERITLFPVGGSANSGQRITIVGDGACVGCAAPDAAQYFSAIRQRWSQYAVVPNQPPPPMVRVASEFTISPNLIAYQMPPTPSGLEVNGVVYTGLINQASYAAFVNIRSYLPAGEHSLATVILNWAISHDLQ